MSIFFQVSAQYGDPKASDIIFPIQKSLNQFFGSEMDEVYLKGVDKLSVVLRVSGKIRDFGAEGPERLKCLKKDKEITIDLAVPESAWRGKRPEDVKSYLRNGFEKSVALLLQRAEKEKWVVDRSKVDEVFVSAFDEVFG